MDDARLSNLLFLAGLASLAIPGCGGVGEPGEGPGGGAPGNPLAQDNGLTGGGGGDVCGAYAAKFIECAASGDDDDDGDYDYDYSGGGYSNDSPQEFADYCEYYVSSARNYAGSGCAMAVLENYACLSELSCAALASGSGCEDVFLALAAACNVGGSGEDDRE